MRKWIWTAVMVLYVAVVGYLLTDLSHINRIQDEEASADKITLTFRHFWIQPHDRPVERIIQDVIRGFEARHPNVKIQFEGLDQNIHREQKLKSEMVTGTQPDIFSLFGGTEIEPYADAGRLMELTPFLKESGLEGKFKDLRLWTFKSGVYGLPMEGNAEPLFYNKRIFDELDIVPPQTVAELDEAVRTLRARGYIPFALGNDQRWPAAIYLQYLMDRYSDPSLFLEVKNGLTTFQNEAYLKALSHYEGWVREGAFPDNANTLSTEDAIRLFTDGKAAMYLNGNWDITLFGQGISGNPFQDDIGVLPFPVFLPDQEPGLAGGYTLGLGVSAELSGEKKEAALALLGEIYTPEVQQRLVYECMRLPSMELELDTLRTGPVFAQVLGLAHRSNEWFIPYDNMLVPEVTPAFLKMTARLTERGVTPEEALRQLQEASEQYWSLRSQTAEP